MNIHRLWRPETFQGKNKKENYFEGWYFKLIDREHKVVLAVIPGISIGQNKADSHAFVQVIDALSGQVEYYRFPYEKFKSDKRHFDVCNGDNHFSDNEITLALANENLKDDGTLYFHDLIKYPSTFFSPGIMGPFTFVPKMECYHGIVNVHHTISGQLTINDKILDMTGGYGYIEKDWGTSFPDSWIWIQGNHFEKPGTTFMFSVARIPWLGKSFTGLIAFLRTETGFYKIATYNGGNIDYIEKQGSCVKGKIHNAKHVLEFDAVQTKGGILKAPKNGLMQCEIEESITAEVQLKLCDSKENQIFQGKSKWVGMEVSGAFSERMFSCRK